MNDIVEFPNDVCEKIKAYVYRLIDPRNGETFYVGKGTGNRVFQHIKCALSENDIDKQNEKYQTINEIHLAGLSVIHVIHRHGMDDNTAKEVEAALIDAYPNATNIVGGEGSNDYGTMNAKQILDTYAAKEADFKHKVVMITVNKSTVESSFSSLYNATRFAWKIDKSRAEQADYVLSVKQGIIKGVFIAKEWKKASIENFPEMQIDSPSRYAFVGCEASKEIQAMYVGKRISSDFRKKGASNPIKYNFEKI